MKIAFSGAAGVGKTTIFNDFLMDDRLYDIEEKIGEFERIPEVVRTLKKATQMEINENGTFETELLVLSSHIRNLLLYRNFITDRCIIDNMIYTGLSKDFQGKDEYEAHNIYLADKLFGKYDLVFYMEKEFNAPEDGVRNLAKEFHDETLKEFSDTYDVLLKKFDNIVILKGNRVERLDIVFKEINKKLKESK